MSDRLKPFEVASLLFHRAPETIDPEPNVDSTFTTKRNCRSSWLRGGTNHHSNRGLEVYNDGGMHP
jgi:hypothetical protein